MDGPNCRISSQKPTEIFAQLNVPFVVEGINLAAAVINANEVKIEQIWMNCKSTGLALSRHRATQLAKSSVNFQFF